MKALKIIVLVLLSVVVIVYGMAFMVYRGVNNTLLNQEYYHTVVSDNEIPALVHDEIANMIPDIVRDGLTGGKTITDPVEKAGCSAVQSSMPWVWTGSRIRPLWSLTMW